MIIKVIYDNCKESQDLQEGWGFSALIEISDRKILFDTGNDQKVFFSNAKKMKISLAEVTDVVFSHKHKDHVTGCKEILENLKENSRVYVPKGFPIKKIPSHLQLQKVEDFVEIDENIFSMVLKGGLFLYEQFLILQTQKGLVIITGCAHPGIITIIKAAQKKMKKTIYFVLGGFHLFNKNAQFTKQIVSEFESLQVEKVAPCHCSGEKTIKQFQEVYKDCFYKVGAGTVLSFN